MLRLFPIPLCALLVVSGCSTTKPIIARDMRSVLPAGRDAIQFPTLEGDTYRLGPNSEIRFLLSSGEATGWIRGRDLRRSDLGLSFEEGGKVYFVAWEELMGAEVQNLSGGKTVAAIALAAVIVGVVVILVASAAKGGGSGSKGSLSGLGSGGSVRTGGSRTRVIRPIRGRRLHHRRLIRPRGGIHIHVPLIIAAGHHHHHYDSGPRDAPPPPPPSGAPAPPPGPAPAGGAVDIHGAPPAATAAATPQVKRKPSPAVPLFNDRARRRSMIQLITSVDAGTELVRFQGYSGSLMVGLRLRDLFEIGGGLRHGIDPLREYGDTDVASSLVGFGRLGFHFWLDDNHRWAIPLSVDVGAGYRTRFHLRVNYGLRFAPIRNLWIGLMPFNTSYTRFDFDSDSSDGRFTFPSTLELGFSY